MTEKNQKITIEHIWLILELIVFIIYSIVYCILSWIPFELNYNNALNYLIFTIILFGVSLFLLFESILRLILDRKIYEVAMPAIKVFSFAMIFLGIHHFGEHKESNESVNNQNICLPLCCAEYNNNKENNKTRKPKNLRHTIKCKNREDAIPYPAP